MAPTPPSGRPEPAPTNQRDHYAALDGLRGFAALSVMLFHIGHWLDGNLATNSGLAVPLFFCLSGYVLPLAYGRRLAGDMSPARFMLVRLVRLMPLVVAATLVSAAYVFLSRILVKHEPIPLDALGLATVMGILDVPYLWAPRSIGGPQVFPLNGPQYSLFLEIAVNVAWMAVIRLDQFKASVALTLACAVAAVWFGDLGGDQQANFWSGFPNVGMAFFAGVAAYHADKRLGGWSGWPVAFWVLAALMAALFWYPVPFGFWPRAAWSLVASPLLVIAGANVRIHGRLRRLSLVGGELSYPVYALHYPIFLWVNGTFQSLAHKSDIRIEAPLISVTVIFIAHGMLKLYDEPLRAAMGRSIRRWGGTSVTGGGRTRDRDGTQIDIGAER